MTVTHSGPDSGYEAATDDPHDEHHPSDAQYWKIGAILGVITLAEVSTYFITDDPYSHDLAPLLIGSLIIMMIAKFFTIGAFFMHLKFDNPVFRWVFVSGLVLAVGVYLVVLTTFAYWDSSYEAGLQLLQ
jgi:cytochrome c oxidase subunit IV